MLVSQPSTSTIILGETGGKVGVSVGVGASVKAVAVSLGVTAVAVSVGVSVGVSEMGAGVVVLVIVKITGVGEKWTEGWSAAVREKLVLCRTNLHNL